MPPVLALLLCTAFVVLLLWLDRKQSLEVTRALWIPTIWILLIAGKPLGSWFRTGHNVESSPLDRTFITCLIIAALWILIRRRFDWPKAIKENIWLVILYSFMLISVLWSSMPQTSFFRWVRGTPAILMAFVILTEPSPRKAIESILRRAMYVLIPFSLLLVKYFPAYGVAFTPWGGRRMWIGVCQQKNSLGRLCIISAFFLIWNLVRRRQGKNPRVWKYQTYLEIIILAISVLLMMGPERNLFYSATSLYAFVFALLIYCGLLLIKRSSIRLAAGPVVAIVGIVMIFGVVSLFTGGSAIGSAASTAGRDATLTGRTVVWQALLPIAMRAPGAGRRIRRILDSREKPLVSNQRGAQRVSRNPAGSWFSWSSNLFPLSCLVCT